MGYSRDDVLSAEQVRKALGLSATHWRIVRHRFPWSYVLGPRCARITWGRVLDTLKPEDQAAMLRRRAS